MRAFCCATSLLVVVTLLMAAAMPVVASTLKTKWSAAAGLTQMVGSTTAADATTVYAAGVDKVRAFDAITGAKKWSIPHPAGLTGDTVVGVRATSDRVVVGYQPGDSISGRTHLYAFDSTDGSQVWSVKYNVAATLAYTETVLLLGSPVAPAFTAANILGYDLSTGSVKFNTTIKNFYLEALSIGAGVVVAQGLENFEHNYNYQVDLTTGKVLCKIQSSYQTVVAGLLSTPVAGNLAAGQGTTGKPLLYDIKTCMAVYTFDSEFVLLVAVKDLFYVVGGHDTMATAFNKDGKLWSTKLNHGQLGRYAGLSALPFQPGAVVANDRGIFSALNTTNGALLWNTSLVVPFAPRSIEGQQVYPLGSNTLFIPNLQGYVVLQNQGSNNVVARNEYAPIMDTFSFTDPTTQTPFVVYGDLHSGDLVAIELSL